MRVLRAYTLAAICVTIALLLTLHIPPLRQQFKFLLFFIAVFASANRGIGPGAFATLLSVAMADYFLVQPVRSFAVPRPGTLVPLFLFCGVGFVTIWLVHRKQRLEETLRTAGAVIESSADGIMRQGLDNTILSWNKAAEHIYGYTAEEAVGRPVTLIVPLDHREELQRLVERVHEGGSVQSHETVRIRKDGTHIHVALTLSPVQDRQGRVIGVSSIARDISERKRAEEELRQSEAQLREALLAAQMGVWEWTLATNTVTWDENLYRIAGRDPKLPPPSYQEHPQIFAPESWKRLDAAVENALATGTPYELDLELVRPDGSKKWLTSRGEPRRDLSGHITRLRGTAQDITDRKRAEERLVEYEKAVEGSQDMIAVVDREYRYLIANQAFLNHRGMERGEVIGHLVSEILGQEAFERDVKSKLGECFQGNIVRFEMKYKYPRLGERALSVTYFPIEVAAGIDRAACVMRDITDRKRTEEALRESEARFRTIFENAATGIALVDVHGHPVESNAALQKMLGYNKFELAGMAFTEFTHPDDARADWDLFTEMVEGKRDQYQMDKRFLRKDGQVVRGQLHVSLVRNQEGEFKYTIGMVEDISERKRTEEALQRSHDQLRALAARVQTVREEERTRVAREIHDELGQALTALKIDLSSLSHELPADREQQSKSILNLVDEMIKSVRRISTELRPVILDTVGLVAAVEWAAEEFEARTGTKCQLDLPQDDVVIVQEHATALFRIFQETLTNVARHSNATEVNVRLAKEDGDLTLEVRDNGKGVSEERLSAGSSLGILGMRERALLLGGKLIITGVLGRGTTVRVRIPATPSTSPRDDK